MARLAQLAQKLVLKEASCIEIEVIIRDFESGPRAGVFADDGAFAFGSTGRRDIERGARILWAPVRSLRSSSVGDSDDAAYGR